MPTTQLWLLGAWADRSSAETRRNLAQVLGCLADGRTDRVLLETCHRVELYGVGPTPSLDPSLELVTGASAVRHLIRVAAGLESAIVGEDDVQHQVRGALARALLVGRVDTALRRLFETSIAVGRRARSRRSHASSNLAQLAVRWLERKADLRGGAVLVVGSGHMGAALAHALTSGDTDVVIASRDPKRAAVLAKVYNAASTDLVGAVDVAQRCTAIAVALSGPWTDLTPSSRRLPPIADISAPPAVSREVSAGLNGTYLSIDDLFTRGIPADGGYVARTLPLVEAKTVEYLEWLESRP